MNDTAPPITHVPASRSAPLSATFRLSAVCVLIGALSLAGWAIPDAEWLLLKNDVFDAPGPMRAMFVIANGVALAFVARRQDRAAWWTVLLTLLVSVLLLLMHALAARVPALGVVWNALNGGRAASGLLYVAQAVLAIQVPIGVLLLLRAPMSRVALLVVTAMGMLLVGGGLFVVIVHAAQLMLPYGLASGPVSFAGVSTTVLQGVALFLLVADRQPTPRVPPRWSPEMATAVAVLCAITLWQAFDSQTGADAAHSRALASIALVLGLGVAGLVYLSLRLLRSNWQQAQRIAHANLSRALAMATDGVWEYDFTDQVMRRGAPQLQHLGYAPEVVNSAPSTWFSLVHPDDQQTLAEYERRLRHSAENACEMSYRIRAADGTYHTIIDRGRVVERSCDGEARLTIGISADVTERLTADRARVESERRFHAIFDSALQGQVLLDAVGNCLEVNGTALAIVGAQRQDVVSLRLTAGPWFTGLTDAQRTVEEHLERATKGEPVRFEAETHLIDGRIGLLECSMAPMSCSAGHVGQVLCEMRDVTERRRSEEALREIGALTTIGRLSARVAHEINNPLAGIQNAFLLLGDAVPVDHPHRRFLQSVEREIQRIASVTRSLYETYRHDAAPNAVGSMPLAVHDAVTFLDQVNRSRGIRITTDLQRAPALVPVPDALLRQTLYNLVQNAVEASPTGGEVAVVVATEGDDCVITVRDEGARIPDHLRERIFLPMSDVRSSVTRTGSMGIGLSLVQQSVKALGGTVTLLDTEGHGATFEVRLPMTSVVRSLHTSGGHGATSGNATVKSE